MAKIKFFRDKNLPSVITSAHEGLWITKPDNSSLMRISLIYDGVIIKDDSIDTATFTQALNLKANDDEVVKILGNQIVKGLKVFENAPQIQVDATVDEDAVRKRQLDAAVSQLNSNIDNLESLVINLLRPVQEIDCSGDPNYPQSLAGDRYLVTEPGKIGGINGVAVDKGDLIVARNDTNGGDEAQAGDDFFIIKSIFDLTNFLDTFVRYDQQQGLTNQEKEVARENIDAVGEDEVVLLEGNQLIDGTKEFINPVKVPAANNNDEAVNKGQLDGLTTYGAESPSTEKVGNWSAGTTITGKTFEEMLENIYAPYQEPSFSSFYIEGYSQGERTIIEVGTSVGGLITFKWSYNQVQNIRNGNTILIESITHGTTITNPALNKGNTTYTTTIPVYVSNTEEEIEFRISGTNTKYNTFSRDHNVESRYALFMGAVPSIPTDGTELRSMLAPKGLNNGNNETYEIKTGVINKDFVIAIPTNKEFEKITVLNTNEDLTNDFILSSSITTVPNAGGTPSPYKVYTLSMAIPFSEDYTIEVKIKDI